MTIVDYVIIGIIAIALLIGVIKGFSGFFFGFFSVLVALGIAVAATMPLAAALGSTQDTLADTISTKMTSTEEQTLFTYQVYKAQDPETEQYSLYMLVPTEDDSTEVMKFDSALDQVGDGFVGTALSILSTPIENAILSNLEVGEGQENAAPFSGYISFVFAKILLRVIIFVVVFIVAMILLRILSSISDKLMEYKAVRVIDHLLGLIISTAIAAGIVLGVAFLAYTYLPGDSSIVGYLDNSVVISAIKNSSLGQSILGGGTIGGNGGEEGAEAIVEEAETMINYAGYYLSALSDKINLL